MRFAGKTVVLCVTGGIAAYKACEVVSRLKKLGHEVDVIMTENATRLVAPLTFDEIRRFHGLLPKPESWEWSATPWSTPCVDEDDTWVMGLNTSGNVRSYNCTITHGSRPAFLIPSQYAVEADGGLDQYTTNELIAEINRRMNG